MARVTDADVQAIMEDYPDALAPFIAVATLLVDEELEPLGVLSDSRLIEIERWLAAHFAATMTPLTTQAGAGSVSMALQRSSPGKGLQATQYGQQAIALDSTGRLKALSDGAVVAVSFGATREPWQTGSSDILEES